MSHYDTATRDAHLQDFAALPQPGAGVVIGRGENDTLQMVLWEPTFHDGRRSELRAESALALSRIIFRRGGQRSTEPAMGHTLTPPVRKPTNSTHFVTTSGYGSIIQDRLRDEPTVRTVRASLDPAADRFTTHHITGLLTWSRVASNRPGGGGYLANTELLPHRPLFTNERGHRLRPAPYYATDIPAVFDPGVGIGLHTYGGWRGASYQGGPRLFPLGTSAEDTVHQYWRLLGLHRLVNIAVKEIGLLPPSQDQPEPADETQPSASPNLFRIDVTRGTDPFRLRFRSEAPVEVPITLAVYNSRPTET